MTAENPIGASNGYNINWDEVDENFDPFKPISSSKVETASAMPHHIPTPSKPDSNKLPDLPLKKSIETVEKLKTDLYTKPDTGNIQNASKLPLAEDRLVPTNKLINEEKHEPTEIDEDKVLSAESKRRQSTSSAATFVLTPANNSPVPTDLDNPDDEISALRAEKEHLTSLVKDMERCIAEYVISLKQISLEKSRAEEAAKGSVVDIIAERDQAIEEISTIEKAFGDLHRRFEKSKQIIEGFKANEDILKKTAEDYQAQLKTQEQNYQRLKAHAEEKLMNAASELEVAKQNNEKEIICLKAAVKRSEIHIKSLESQLNQKIRENTELTTICDELLSKYGDKV